MNKPKYTGQIRFMHSLWILSYTDGKVNKLKKFKKTEILIEFCNKNDVKIMNTGVLTNTHKENLKH